MVDAASEVNRQRARRGRCWALTPCLLAALAGCAPAVSAARHTVHGRVSLGPQCGGPQREGQSCDVDYEAVEVRLLDAEGRITASALTNAQGRFTLSGPAGRYTVRVVTPKVVRCPAAAVELPATQAASLTIACDSGRR